MAASAYLSPQALKLVMTALDAIKAKEQWSDVRLGKRLGIPPNSLRSWRRGVTGPSVESLAVVRHFLHEYARNA